MNFGATDPIPYTHSVHARRCREAAEQHVWLDTTFVQVRSGPLVYCGRIIAAWDHDQAGEMWKLELTSPQAGVRSFPARRARQCSGIDGRCVCESLAHGTGGYGASATDATGRGAEGVTC